MSRFFLLAVQPPDSEIQIGRKCYPQKIWNAKIRRFWRNRIKFPYHPDDQDPQKKQPQEGKEIPSEAEKEDRPEKVNCQLHDINR